MPVMPVLTDDQLNKINKRRRDWSPLRNLTPQQWADIAARLPKPPARSACYDFLLAANNYWYYALWTPKKRTRLMFEAVEQLRTAIEKVRTAWPEYPNPVTVLSEIHGEAQMYADGMREMMLMDDRPLDARHYHRHAFLGAALDFWASCGGKPKFSRDKVSKTPGGPLIRYLTFVSQLVMKEKAPRPDTLADFVVKWRRPLD